MTLSHRHFYPLLVYQAYEEPWFPCATNTKSQTLITGSGFALAFLLCRRFSKGFVCCAHKMAGEVRWRAQVTLALMQLIRGVGHVPFGLTQHKTSLENSWSFPSWVGEVSPDPFTL